MSNLQFDTEELKEIIAAALHDKLQSAINYGEMHKLVDEVLSERKPEFDALLNEMFDAFFKDPDVKQALIEEFKHKVAKTMVGKLDGAVEKNIAKYRQDPATNAKMILAIEKIITETDL
jgi:dihydroneopterin aldolase